MLCRSYRESYGIRIACGILFNHESRRRGPQFLSRKVVDHVQALRAGDGGGPARARQPEGAARLGLRARLRRRDGRDPPPGGGARRRRRGCRLPRLRPRHRAACTPCGSSPTAPSRSRGSSSSGSSTATTRSAGTRGSPPRASRRSSSTRPSSARPTPPAIAADPRRDRGRARLGAAAGARPLPRGHALRGRGRGARRARRRRAERA